MPNPIRVTSSPSEDQAQDVSPACSQRQTDSDLLVRCETERDIYLLNFWKAYALYLSVLNALPLPEISSTSVTCRKTFSIVARSLSNDRRLVPTFA